MKHERKHKLSQLIGLIRCDVFVVYRAHYHLLVLLSLSFYCIYYILSHLILFEYLFFNLFKRHVASTYHHRELAFLQSDHAARHRRIHHVPTQRSHFFRQRTAHGRTHRAHVNEGLPCAHAGQHSGWTFGDRRDRGRVRHHRENVVRRFGDLAWRVRPFHSFLHQPLRLRARAVVANYVVPLAQQPVHHLAAHHAEPNES